MNSFVTHRPLGFSLLLALLWVVVPVPFALFLPILAPGMPELMQRFVALVAMSVLLLGLLSRLSWWRKVGFNRPSEWRALRLLWLPTLILLWPLTYGARSVTSSELALLTLGYLLTGLMEEALGRGLILQSLLPKGVMRAVIISALLFGSVHVGRLLFGSPPVLVLFQVIFAACDGVLYAALRVRTRTLWPLVLLHAAGDLTLALSQVPQPLWSYFYLGTEVLVLAYGLYLLRAYWQPVLRRRPQISITS